MIPAAKKKEMFPDQWKRHNKRVTGVQAKSKRPMQPSGIQRTGVKVEHHQQHFK